MKLLRYPLKQLAIRVVCTGLTLGLLIVIFFGGVMAYLPLVYDSEPDLPSHWPTKRFDIGWTPPWSLKNWGLW